MPDGIGKLRVTETQLADLVRGAVRLHGDFRVGGMADVREPVKNGSLLPKEEQQPQADWKKDLAHSCSAARSNTVRGY